MLGINQLSIRLGSTFTALFGVTTRFFTELQSSLSQSWTVPDLGVATTSAKITASFATIATEVTAIIAGRHAGDRFYIATTGGNLLIGHGTAFSQLAVVNDGKLHTVVLEQIGTQLTATLDGVEVLDVVSDFTLDMTTLGIGRNAVGIGADLFTGIIADVEMEIDSENNIILPLNEDFSTTSTAINYGSIGASGNATAVNITESDLYTQVDDGWTGVELVTQDVWENPNFVQSEWAFVDNQWVLTGSGAFSLLRLIELSDQPYFMRLIGDVSGLSGDLAAKNAGAGGIITANGNYTFDILGSDDQSYKRTIGVVNATLDKPSIKRLIEVAP